MNSLQQKQVDDAAAIARRAKQCAQEIMGVMKKYGMGFVIIRTETLTPNGALVVKYGIDYVPADSAELAALEQGVVNGPAG